MTMPDLIEVVREKYGEAARRAADGASASCCGPVSSCCGGSAFNGTTDPITSNLYVNGETDELPSAAVLASLGCGNPTALAQLEEGETVLDLGSGGGIDVILSARRVGKTGKAYGLDMTDDMLDLARKNAVGYENVQIVERSVGQFLAEQKDRKIDFALLDPPRSGTEKKTVLDLIRLRPKRVSYVSCDPSVLSRDLRRFLDAGYTIESITAIDLFPQTHHVETVVKLIDQ
jgi:SAM-dependent methyltransferase